MGIKFEDLVKGNIEVYNNYLIHDDYALNIDDISRLRYREHKEDIIIVAKNNTQVLNLEFNENETIKYDLRVNDVMKICLNFIKRKEIEEI